MSNYHAFYYESEARIRQADKVEQACRWRMVKEANASRVQPVKKATLLSRPLINSLHKLFDTVRSYAVDTDSVFSGLKR